MSQRAKLLATLMLLLAALVMSAPAAAGEAVPAAPSAPAAQAAEVAPHLESPRHITVRAVEGTVTVQHAAEAAAAASVGEQLTRGSQLRTGPGSRAVLELEDGTLMVVSPDSSLTVDTLEGTPQTPLTRFLLAFGEVFAARDGSLPGGAAFEILTPHGVAAIRGSAMRVTVPAAADELAPMRMACLEGRCYAGAGVRRFHVRGGESVTVEADGRLVLGGLTDADLAAWRAAIEAIRAAGLWIDDAELSALLARSLSEPRVEDGPAAGPPASAEPQAPDLSWVLSMARHSEEDASAPSATGPTGGEAGGETAASAAPLQVVSPAPATAGTVPAASQMPGPAGDAPVEPPAAGTGDAGNTGGEPAPAPGGDAADPPAPAEDGPDVPQEPGDDGRSAPQDDVAAPGSEPRENPGNHFGWENKK